MTVPAKEQIQRAQALATQWADRNTPFIFEEWYVAALVEELSTQPIKRTLLGRDIAMFKTASGKFVAFDDRCVHRSYPLSLGRVDGETLVCGYHGIRYDVNGDIVEIPSQPKCPRGLGVKQYKVHQMGPLLWIWMGDADQGDIAKIPGRPWMYGNGWTTAAGYLHMKSSYVTLHENLLDLTHLSFLHANSFGTPDYASAPYDVTIKDDYFALTRRVVPTKLPPVWAKSTGLGTKDAARVATSEFLSPGAHETTATFYDCALSEAEREEFAAKTCHLPTPETADSTHYFVVDGRSFATHDTAITQFMHEQLLVVFNEDVVGLEHVQNTINKQPREEFFELSFSSDRASIEMRKYLKRRAEAEHGANLVAGASSEARASVDDSRVVRVHAMQT